MNNDEKYNTVISSMREFTYKWQPENYDDPSKPILKITKSSLGSFDWCPKKYEFSYRQRLPQDQTEAMLKGTILHNHREDFFNIFDLKKAEKMNNSEVLEYCTSLMPVDDYYDISLTVASLEAQRYIEARTENKIEEFLPVCNEGKFDAEITIPANINPKFPLQRDYVIHIQGIIDRIFKENGGLEMAFYELLLLNAPDEVMIKNGLDPNDKVTHWGWYYPAANYIYAEPRKTRSMTSVMNNIAKLIHHYERNTFPAKFFYKTCAHCSFFGICDEAQEDTWV